MVPIMLVIGVQGSGKSWVCRQLGELFTYIPHDRCWKHPMAVPEPGLDPKWGPPGSVSIHFEEISEAAKGGRGKCVLTEVPFGESELKKRLEAAGYVVLTVFVVESDAITAARYEKREKKPISAGALTRQRGLGKKAAEWGSFVGTSQEVLEHLRRTFGFVGKKPAPGA